MTTTLVPFDNGTYSIRTLEIDGEPWFVASDIAKTLGYRDAANMNRRLDDEDTRSFSRSEGTHSASTLFEDQRIQSVSLINESGLYTAILGSQLPEAKPFKRWVTSEVLPAIRKTGGYSIEEHVTPAPGKPVELQVRQYEERARRKRNKELAERGLYENTLTGEILPLPGVTLKNEVPGLVETYVQQRRRQALKSADDQYETQSEFKRNAAWQEAFGEK